MRDKCVCVWERGERARARGDVYIHTQTMISRYFWTQRIQSQLLQLEVNALNTVWQLRLDKPHKTGFGA